MEYKVSLVSVWSWWEISCEKIKARRNIKNKHECGKKVNVTAHSTKSAACCKLLDFYFIIRQTVLSVNWQESRVESEEYRDKKEMQVQ